MAFWEPPRNLCIVCNSFIPEKKIEKPLEYRVTRKQKEKLEEKRLGLEVIPHLRPFFVIKEIFKLPKENVCDLLTNLGNPSEWFEMCEPCSNSIDEGIEVLRKLKRLEERIAKIKEELCGKVQTSRLQETDDEVETPGFEDVKTAYRRNIRKSFPLPTICSELPVPTEQGALEVKVEDFHSETELDEPVHESYFEPESLQEMGDANTLEESTMSHRWETFIMVEMDAGMTSSDKVTKIENQEVPLMLTPEEESIKRTDATAMNPHTPRIVAVRSLHKSLPKKKPMVKLAKRLKLSETFQKPKAPPKRKRKPRLWYYKPQTERKNMPNLSDKVSESHINECESDPKVSDYMDLPGRTLRKRKPTKRKFIFDEDEDENDDELDEDYTIEEDEHDNYEQEDSDEEDGKEDFDNSQHENSVKKINLDRCNNSVRKAKDLLRHGPPSVAKSNNANNYVSRWERILNIGNELLDMSLIAYPPETEEERLKIPKKLHKRAAGSVRNENGATNIATDYKCPSCGKYFTHKYFAISHIHRFHLGIIKHWTCNQCSKKFSDARRISEHLRLHDAGKLFCCPVCKSFQAWSQEKLDYHIACHQKDVLNPICDPCGETFANFKTYMRHMCVKHGITDNIGSKQRIVCEICSKTFPYKRSFKFHQVKHHGHADEEGIFPICSQCGQIHMSANLLECHIQRDHIKATNFFCDQCGAGFAVESQLKNHIDHVHTEATPITCHVCNFVVRNKKGFTRHMSKIHPEAINMSADELEAHKKKLNEEKPHKCTLCDKSFAFNIFLYHHYRNEHPEVTDKFRCEVCGKGYSRACSVKRHYESVHEKKTVQCQYCNKEVPVGNMYQHHQTMSCLAKRKAEADAKNSSTSTSEQPTTSSISTTTTTSPTPATTLFPTLEPHCSRTQQQQFENLSHNHITSTDSLYTSLVEFPISSRYQPQITQSFAAKLDTNTEAESRNSSLASEQTGTSSNISDPLTQVETKFLIDPEISCSQTQQQQLENLNQSTTLSHLPLLLTISVVLCVLNQHTTAFPAAEVISRDSPGSTNVPISTSTFYVESNHASGRKQITYVDQEGVVLGQTYWNGCGYKGMCG
ncbi:unnamed protein product [Orchesella dallaii]|uniref:C2H2-type domain-containing protein n=1 Tax=Orchesella dallaii TaxID=48710 RepID=A0ABP1Q3G7_9HEXA